MIRRFIQLILDQASAKKVERQTSESMGKVAKDSESKLTKAFKRVGLAIVAAFAVRAIVGFTREMFRLGASAAETGSKFETVFGEKRAAELDTFLERFRTLAGLTRTQGREMLANFGAVFQGAGIAADASAKLSRQMVELAADLQSFHDVPIAETFAAIRSGATSEAEPLKRFGIVLRAVDVDARALANTGKRATKELTEQERVVARLQLIYEKAGTAVGHLVRTQDSNANRARRVNARFEQIRETIAVGLMPALERLLPLFEQLADKAEVFANKTAGVVQALLDFAGIADQEVAIEIASITRQLEKMDEAQRQAFLTSRLVRAANEYQTLRERIVAAQTAMFNATPGFERVGKSVEDMTNRVIAGMQEEMEQAGAVMNFISGQLAAGREAIEAAGAGAPSGGDAAGREAIEAAGAGAPSGGDADGLPDISDPALRNRLQRGELDREQRFHDAGERLRESTKEMAEGMRDVIEDVDPFGALIEQVDLTAAYMRDGFAGVGRAIVAQLTEGRAEEQFAQGLAALASGLWPPNPAALAAAAKHFAAAAAFRALGAAGRSLGGGGGAGLPRGAIGTSAPATQQLPGAEVHIYLDQLSPADPRFQRVVMGATQNARERFGDNVRVNVHPRTA